MMLNNASLTQPFSERYEMVHKANVFLHKGKAIIDEELARALGERFSRPIVGRVGGLHYQFKPESSVPGMSVAVPESRHHSDDVLLIRK